MSAGQAWQVWVRVPLVAVMSIASYRTGVVAKPDVCGDGMAILASPQLYACARQTAVKVINGESWGSGTIIWQQGDRYGALTNAHVLRAAEKPASYCVQTADGRRHAAVLSTAARFPNTDLALLEFRSSVAYTSARLSTNAHLLQQEVVAVGFPHNRTTGAVAADGFAFERGIVRRLLNRPLQDGYQIGYDGQIGKGMSGGAVLGMNGEVIAINGWHAHPLWLQAFTYQDGSTPSPQLQSELARLNWGIPARGLQARRAPTAGSDVPPPSTACGPGARGAPASLKAPAGG